MRFVYAHFPINSSVNEDNSEVKINNFLGEKIQRVCHMVPGVKVFRSEKVKDEIILQGNNVESVATSGWHFYISFLLFSLQVLFWFIFSFSFL